MKRKYKAQSIVEYCVLIGIVSIAFVALQTYARRGIQSVIKVSSDRMGRQQDAQTSLINHWPEGRKYSEASEFRSDRVVTQKVHNVRKQEVNDGIYTSTDLIVQENEFQGADVSNIIFDNE